MSFENAAERGFLFAPPPEHSPPVSSPPSADQQHQVDLEPEIPVHLREDPLRRAVVERLRLAAVRHCRHVAELAGTPKAVGPHGVMFFYSDPGARGHSDSVRLASRLFFNGPDVTEVLKILRILNALALDYKYSAFDPRIHMSNRVEDMHREANFVGVGVTTVLPSVRRGTRSRPDNLGLDRPHQGIMVLRDGAEIVLRGSGSFGQVDVQSTHNLDHKGRPIQNWRWAPLNGDLRDSAFRAIFEELAHLRDIVLAAEDGPQLLERVPVRLSAARTHRKT